MSVLVDLTDRATTTKGIEHIMVINTLRHYIMATDNRRLIGEINKIFRQDQLRALWEAGLNTELQQAVVRRLEELAQRRT